MENKKRKTKVTVKRNILNNLNGTLYTYYHESMSVFFSQTNIKSLLITFWRSDNPATACCCWKLRCRGSASWPLFYRGGRYRWWCWLIWANFVRQFLSLGFWSLLRASQLSSVSPVHATLCLVYLLVHLGLHPIPQWLYTHCVTGLKLL